jgi:succinate dehydrogenase / fumarate reductase flavoprotein subunit
MKLDSNIPGGPIQEKWDTRKFELKLVNPANKRKYKVLVVGSGLAGASAAATLAELGYQVECFCFQDSPRRAHSIAAQGGINAAKNYRNDGDSIWRLFYDTVKGGDFRAREANVYRLAQCSVNIIDQAVASGVPLRATTAVCSIIAASAAPRSRARSTRVARLASNCCWGPTRACRGRSGSAR